MSRQGRKPAASVEELFHARTEPIDGGHLRWTGHTDKNTGVPSVRYGGKLHTAYRVAFRIRHGRDPQGNCTSDCGYDGCVAPDHVDDDATRTRTRAVLASITGQESPETECRRGHAAAEYRRYMRDGRPYCGACTNSGDKAAA